MASPITIYFLGVAPIPIGHRVEVRTYFVETGLFSKKLEPNFDHPQLTDLDTGVVYSNVSNYQTIIAYTPNTRYKVPTEPRADLKLHGCWQGVVRQTIVMWIGFGPSAYPQTTFVIDPIEPPRR